MLKIVKIGGNIVDNSAKLRDFLVDFAALPGDKILVHGGGKVATSISAALGVETIMIEGRRVTDRQTLEVVTMVYSGINKQIVSMLQAFGCNAIGLCGADGRLIVSKKRVSEPINYGFVGDPVDVNAAFAQQLVGQGITLVIAPITLDDADPNANDRASVANFGVSRGVETSRLLNTNADTVAQTIAVAMAKLRKNGKCGDESGSCADVSQDECSGVELVYCFEKQGVLLNVEDENSVIERIDRARFAELKASCAVHSGMLPKLENAFRALDGEVAKVVICAAENIAKPGYGGTTIVE
ncbi:MAG: acetylglutamate kinase [Alistipes sp.]|jgi:acetylglutamate kinase|nr:acetylglutamate kinase [Alistipes sp.]